MRDHPVTPMTDANLMRLMDAQAQGRAGNVTSRTLDQGVDAVRAALADLRKSGYRYGVLDALTDAHLHTMGQAVSGMVLVTGGSGLADGMARTWRAGHAATDQGQPPKGRPVILSGSCSQMTNAQVAAYLAEAPSLSVSVARALRDPEYPRELAAWVAAHPSGGLAPMLYATTGASDLKYLQEKFGAAEASAAIERVFGAVAPLLEAAGYDQFIVAGGETAGVVTQSLSISGFHIGPQIAPGVPWVRATTKQISLALKSGNFGAERFFFDAQSHLK